ncbi:MAG TPA: hypothetical protein VGR81_13060 [Candidatus Acidoferrales bacterium]|nr:hypothetical protein [Candidatus Acidoferrales bacterium]
MEILDVRRGIAGRTSGRIVAAVLVLVILAAAGATAQSAEDLKKKYPKMAPIDEYLMNRDAEIALARSAAPEAISKDASVLVLTRKGWETAVKGTNGFVCLVERGWTGHVDFPEVWNPKIRGADCLNPAAVRSVLPTYYKLTQMALAGDSEEERIAGIQAAYAKKELLPVEPGAMGYMMSKKSYLADGTSNNLCHVMPFVAAQKMPPMRTLVIAVLTWSDGTPADSMGGDHSR